MSVRARSQPHAILRSAPLSHAALVAAVTIALLAAAASGQGFRAGLSEAVPGPISSLDLARWATAINLSEAQRRGLEALHDQYKVDFALLADTTLAEFIAIRQTVDGMPFRRQPSKSEMERWLASEKAAMDAIAALDEQLFAGLDELIIEDQQPALQRVRLARERQRLVSSEIVREWLHPSTQTDLCEIFATVAPEFPVAQQEVVATAWVVLDGHQGQYLGMLRGLREAARDMYGDFAKQVEEQGLVHVDFSQRGYDQQAFVAVLKLWQESIAKAKPRMKELVEANRSGAKNVAKLLAEDNARTFMRQFLRTAYQRGVMEDVDNSEKGLLNAMMLEGITKAEREAIQTTLDEFQRETDGLLQAAADAEDRTNEGRLPSLPLALSPEDREMVRAAFNAVSDACRAASKSLTDILGEDRATAYAMQRSDDRLREMLRQGGVTDGAEIEELVAQSHQGKPISLHPRSDRDTAFADAIARSEIDALSVALGLDIPRRDIAHAIHGDYFRQYRNQFDDAYATLLQLRTGLGRRETSPQAPPRILRASPDDITQALALEQTTLTALRQLDAAFFNDLEAALSGVTNAQTRLSRMRLSRDLAVLARGKRPRPEELRTFEAQVPLVSILDRLPVSEEEFAKSSEIFATNADSWRETAQAHFDAASAARQANERYSAERQSGSGLPPEVRVVREAEIQELDRKAKEMRAALAALHQSLLEQLIVALPSHAEALRDSWERAAFPRVFADAQNAEPLFAKALALSDLGDRQRADIESLISEHRPAYRDLCARMIEINLEWDRQPVQTDEGRATRDAAKYRWDQLLFQRDELNAKARAALGRILTPNQQLAIGLAAGDAE